MEWQRHIKEPPPVLLALLEAYPFKEYQNRRLGISSSDIAKYQFDTFRKVDLKSNLFKTFGEGGNVLSCFCLVKHRWHSEFFNREIYRVGHLLFVNPRLELRQEVATEIWTQTRNGPINLLTARVDCEDHRLASALSDVGFEQVGQSVKLVAEMNRLDTNIADQYTSEIQGSSVTIRSVVPEDVPRLKRIAKAGHRFSHYFNDPRLVKLGARKLFPAWVEKCAEGAATEFLVALEGRGKRAKPVGFVTLILNARLAEYTGRRPGVIDFIAVDPKKQGRGIGRMLMGEAIRWLSQRADYVEVRTELANFPAIKFYQSLGFEIVSADVDLHCWLN